MAASVLGQQLTRLGLFEVSQESTDGEWAEVVGRVSKDNANAWGEWIKKILVDEFRMRFSGSVDISRHYRAVTQVSTNKCLVDTIGPDGKPAKTERDIQIRGEKLIWVWRVRATSAGLSLVTKHVSQYLSLKARQNILESSGGRTIPLGTDGINPSGLIVNPIRGIGSSGADNISSLPKVRIG